MTNATRARFKRALKGTIWGPELALEVPQRYRPIYTIALPVQYLLFTAFGIVGSWSVVPAVAVLTSVSYSDLWALMVGITSLLSGVGLILRSEGLELYLTVALAVGFVTYPLSMLVLAVLGDGDRLALALGMPVFLILPVWRIIDLAWTIRKRKEGEASASSSAGAA